MNQLSKELVLQIPFSESLLKCQNFLLKLKMHTRGNQTKHSSASIAFFPSELLWETQKAGMLIYKKFEDSCLHWREDLWEYFSKVLNLWRILFLVLTEYRDFKVIKQMQKQWPVLGVQYWLRGPHIEIISWQKCLLMNAYKNAYLPKQIFRALVKENVNFLYESKV